MYFKKNILGDVVQEQVQPVEVAHLALNNSCLSTAVQLALQLDLDLLRREWQELVRQRPQKRARISSIKCESTVRAHICFPMHAVIHIQNSMRH